MKQDYLVDKKRQISGAPLKINRMVIRPTVNDPSKKISVAGWIALICTVRIAVVTPSGRRHVQAARVPPQGSSDGRWSEQVFLDRCGSHRVL